MPTPLTPDQTLYLARNPNLLKEINPECQLESSNWLFSKLAFKTLDPDTQLVKDKAIKLAPRDEPVLIRGESGTGKELLASILHGTRTGNFVAVNSTAVTETLFESELFGHVRGSFTGATDSRAGLIAHANRGTLFLDEIGDTPISLQPKLLRVIQTKKYRIVGGNQDQQVQCRFIAATHMNLEAMVKAGTFRLDLYHRLTTFQLRLKPLRDRLCDIPLHIKDSKLLASLQADTSRRYEGNIRELENASLQWEVFGKID